MRSGTRCGWWVLITDTYIAKHWVQVARSGKTFLVRDKSDTWTSTTWPSRTDDNGLLFPFAGGVSVKHNHLPWSSPPAFFGKAGIPRPSDTTLKLWPLVPSPSPIMVAASFGKSSPWLCCVSRLATDGSWASSGSLPSCTPACGNTSALALCVPTLSFHGRLTHIA